MDKNTIIGFSLIFILLIVWQQLTAPSAEEMEARRRAQDSLLQVQKTRDSLAQIPTANIETAETQPANQLIESDSLVSERLKGEYGPFSAAAEGGEKGEELIKLKNDLIEITFSNKGGYIKEVLLFDYFKVSDDVKKKEVKTPLRLLEDEKNKFEYFIPIANLPSGGVKTSDLYFDYEVSANKITFRANAGDGKYFEQTYSIEAGNYLVDYDIKFVGLQNTIAGNVDEIQLNWLNYLDKLEKNHKYERNYSSIYYKKAEGGTSYCSCTSDDEEDVDNASVKWIAHSNQFFNTALIADSKFNSVFLETKLLEKEDEDLKQLNSKVNIPFGHSPNETFAMNLYLGPNEFNRLRAYGEDLEDIVPFGRSIFGEINRWIIRPLFGFLSGFIGSKGIVILVLTFLVKLVLYPLTYKMLYSQSKMAALKPRIEGMKEKLKDDQKQQQMETMKLYREFGVNPLGGCMPMVLQMPIWFALYRFFPASIEFRQSGFLWATDLSSYDVFVQLPLEIPFGFGSHISLFTVSLGDNHFDLHLL